MQVTSNVSDPLGWSGGLLVISRSAGAAPSALETRVDEKLGKALSTLAERLLFKGKPRQVVALETGGRLPAARVLLIGTGEGPLTPAAARDLAALAVADANGQRLRTVGFALADADAALASELAAGALLGGYRWDAYKSKDADAPTPEVECFELLTGADVTARIARGTSLANAVSLARTLVNEPPNECTPRRFAALAQALGGQLGLTVAILEREDMVKRNMGGLLAVSAGSAEPPRLIHLAYTPKGPGAAKKPLVFVGKGLTFDSGGLSLKPAKSMEDMYIDMAGGAAVMGLMMAVGELKPDVPVHGIIGATENMPGGAAYRPSDILRMANGKTVEVLNTDAEGRLVLADCLHYGTELKPAALIDLATLTGACMVALGSNYSGLFTAHEDLATEILAAAGKAGELIWRMPLDKKLGDSIKSQRADIKNLGGSWGGAITAALFLQHFVGDTRWAHLDIAGPVLADKDDGHIRAGGTGYGVLTLWSLVEAASA